MTRTPFPGLSAHAQYQNVFARQQSPRMRNAEWEDRLAPYWSWSEIGSAAGILLFLAAVILVVM